MRRTPPTWILRSFWKVVLGAAGISVVAAFYYLPEARAPIAAWILMVAIAWRPSPKESG